MLAKSDNSWSLPEAAHLLNRAGFGGSPEEIKALHALGRFKAVESLVAPDEPLDAIPVPVWARPENAAGSYSNYRDALKETMEKTRGLPADEAAQVRRQARKVVQREQRELALEAQNWWFRKILSTRAPLREKMTLFWHDHFATSFQKVKQPALLMRQNELFRANAFGSFKDLTKSVVRDPAMMLYLDSQNSSKGKPNENFSREVMELFTLGEGNYTEDDVREAARAFTGYRINRQNGLVVFQENQWDEGRKKIFGKTGAFEGEEVVDLIFEQKAASRLVPAKLWEYFVAEDPSRSVVDSLADSFRGAGFQTGPLLREIFLSKEFYSDAVVRSQIKPPVQFLVELLKQLEITEPPAGFPLEGQQQLGQQLFNPPNVAGWDWGKAWINTNTLLTRYNLAGYITKGAESAPALAGDGKMPIANRKDASMEMQEDGMMEMSMGKAGRRGGRNWKGPDYEKIAPRPLREDPEKLVDSLIYRFFQGPLPEKARASFVEYAIVKKGAVFTNKEVGELAHLILSTPYYQLT